MAAELVGGAFLSATLQVLFDRLASREVLSFFRRPNHDDRLLKKLKLAFLGVNAVLDDAEKQQITNPSVKEWVDELKDAIYHADDLLDEIATLSRRSKSECDYQSSPNQAACRIFPNIFLDCKVDAEVFGQSIKPEPLLLRRHCQFSYCCLEVPLSWFHRNS